jgi:hypothetical protein
VRQEIIAPPTNLLKRQGLKPAKNLLGLELTSFAFSDNRVPSFSKSNSDKTLFFYIIFSFTMEKEMKFIINIFKTYKFQAFEAFCYPVKQGQI